MKTIKFKIGQVWRGKNNNEKVVIIAISKKSVFVSPVLEVVDPEWSKEYLKEHFEQDSNYTH